MPSPATGDAVGSASVGAANYITAASCETTGDQPAGVCASPVIKALEAKP